MVRAQAISAIRGTRGHAFVRATCFRGVASQWCPAAGSAMLPLRAPVPAVAALAAESGKQPNQVWTTPAGHWTGG